MSIWGPGIYQNDVSDDVRSYFRDQLHRGKDASQITQELMESLREALMDLDDRPNFWLALADVQWDMGMLLPEVKANALACLSDGSALLPWAELSGKDLSKRRQALDKLAEKLNTPQPPKKKVSQYRLYQCPWKTGDVFALPLESEQAQILGIAGGWLLLEKIGERIWYPGHHIPEMYAKIFIGSVFPSTLAEYDQIKYIKRSSDWCDLGMFSRPTPSDQSIFANRIRSIDKNGYLTEYRFKMITTSQRTIPKKLIYIGNFTDARHPAKEYIPQFDADIKAYFWKELEENMLWCYSNVK